MNEISIQYGHRVKLCACTRPLQVAGLCCPLLWHPVAADTRPLTRVQLLSSFHPRPVFLILVIILFTYQLRCDKVGAPDESYVDSLQQSAPLALPALGCWSFLSRLPISRMEVYGQLIVHPPLPHSLYIHLLLCVCMPWNFFNIECNIWSILPLMRIVIMAPRLTNRIKKSKLSQESTSRPHPPFP